MAAVWSASIGSATWVTYWEQQGAVERRLGLESEGLVGIIIIIIIIIMGLRSVSASEDVIGDPSRSGTNNSDLLEPRREEK